MRNMLQRIILSLVLASTACGGSLFDPGHLLDPTAILNRIDVTLTNVSTDANRSVAELESLVTYLANQGLTQAATYVRDILQNGIARVGIEFRCNVDYLAQRLKQGLMALRAAFEAKRSDTSVTASFPPTICTATPDQVAWPEAPQSISLAGYDFHRDGMSVVVVGRAGQVSDISSAAVQPSPYQLVVNLSSSGAAFPRDCARIEVRWQGSALSTVPCLTDCPPPPPPTVIPAVKNLNQIDTTRKCVDSFLTGCRIDDHIDQKCPDGFNRDDPFTVVRLDGKGPGNCGEGDQNDLTRLGTTWLSHDPHDCSIHVHVGLQGGTFQGFRSCHYIVTATKPEEVITHPPPQVGWCH
jgi:hypothetical protein